MTSTRDLTKWTTRQLAEQLKLTIENHLEERPLAASKLRSILAELEVRADRPSSHPLFRTFEVWLPTALYVLAAEDVEDARRRVEARAEDMAEPYASQHREDCRSHAVIHGTGPLGLVRIIRTFPRSDVGTF